MTRRFRVSGRAGRALALAVFTVAAASSGAAQQAQPSEPPGNSLPAKPQAATSESRPRDSAQAQNVPSTSLPVKPGEHGFWDRKNGLLFAAVGAGRALDYASTLNLRRRGLNEALLTNEIVDNHALFAGIEVAGTAASIGVSYLFHRTGHHRLERWTSIVHFGVATGGAIRNYSLPTPH